MVPFSIADPAPFRLPKWFPFRLPFPIAPPSLHPSGIRYSWLNPFRDLPRLIDPVEEGLIPKTEKTKPSQQITALGNSLEIDTDRTVENLVAIAIRQTLPKRFGERNDQLFEFARRLKAVPNLRDKSANSVLKFVEEWFRAALPNISTKEWKVTRDVFLSAWKRIRHPWTNRILKTFLDEVDVELPSPIALRYASDPVLMRLTGLCERLQKYHRESPFFLSTEACGLFGLPHKNQLHRRIKRLMDDGILSRVSTGNSYQRVASEYFFLPGIEQANQSRGSKS
ncbi:MAG: hypothetical protein WCH39_15230 [Schlesneria sp.]